MEEEFDGIQFADYVRRRWSIIALSCLAGVVVAGGISFMIPKRYTSTASILIEPPAGNDPRSATALSAVYLESLKTYERVISSDTAFATALRDLGLRKKFGDVGIEGIKRSVLKVSRPVSTKIVEISATLDDPVDAQRLAQNVAEQSVALNRRLDDQSSEAVVNQARKILDTATGRLKKAEQNRDEITREEGLDVLQNDVTNANQLRLSIELELGRTRAALADTEAEAKTLQGKEGSEERALFTQREVEEMRARVTSLEAQVAAITKTTTDTAAVLEARRLRREPLDNELHAARVDYEAARNRLAEVQYSSASHGERLEIMDCGVVPEHPSSPNVMLNVMVAALVSLVFSVGYLAVQFGYSRARS
jgi:uncharacterized protein involved in exopolysaccharide biosynthesis